MAGVSQYYIGKKPFLAKPVTQSGVPGYVIRVGDSTSWVRQEIFNAFAEAVEPEAPEEKAALLHERQMVEVNLSRVKARLNGLTGEGFNEQRALLQAQTYAMQDYLGILNRRIAAL